MNYDPGSCIYSLSDIDVAEATEVADATTMMMTNKTADGNITAVEFLSIQNEQSGSISQINATAYTLELNNVANSTIVLSDRPERIVETVSTADFIGNWSTGPNDAPPAVVDTVIAIPIDY
jgi:hypothetical protein